MDAPKVSIIIPIYRSEAYIVQCMDSIARQTFHDYEVILVNDGSPDKSTEIITKFISENRLKNFQLVNKDNKGVSSARNAGLRLANGEWIAFIDSDDWVEPNYLENMLASIAQNDSDLCLCGYDAYEMAEQRFDPWSSYPQKVGKIPDDLAALTSFDYIWGRLYKKSILDAHKIFFNEKILYCEDNAFNFDYIRAIKSFSCVDEVGYHYRRGHTSALSRSLVQPRMRVHFIDHAQRFWDSFDEEIMIATLKTNRSFARIIWNVISTAIIVDILEKNKTAAKTRMNSSMGRAVKAYYMPYTKKERAILFLWKHSFLGLRCLVRVYYRNFQEIKKHKRFFRFISH